MATALDDLLLVSLCICKIPGAARRRDQVVTWRVRVSGPLSGLFPYSLLLTVSDQRPCDSCSVSETGRLTTEQ